MIAALTAVSWLMLAVVAVPLAIFALEVSVGLLPSRKSDKAAASDGGTVAVLIPAHNEEGGITTTIEQLRPVLPDGSRILVVADNCTDATVARARSAGAEVIERNDTTARGKGFALAFGRDHLAAGSAPDVVIVLDADCRLSPGSVEALASAVRRNHAPAQAVNLISGDLSAAPMVQISSFAMVVKNLYRSRGMQRMGGAALLTGTGMAFPWRLFARADLATGSIVEDLALGIELTRSGHTPKLIEDAGVRSAPADMRDALQQRTRWEHGFLQTVKRHALPELLGGLRRGSLAEFLLGLHLIVPPMALLLMTAFVTLALMAGFTVMGASLLPLALLTALVAIVMVLIGIAWLAGGRPYLSASALLKAPLYLLWKLPVYVGFLRKPITEWNRTPRRDG